MLWERALHAWDLVGGAAIVQGAGGQVTDLDDGAFDGETDRILASNGLIHALDMNLADAGRSCAQSSPLPSPFRDVLL